MVAHRSRTDLFASLEVSENRAEDTASATEKIRIRMDQALLVVSTGTHDRILPDGTDVPLGLSLTVINDSAGSFNVIDNSTGADLTGGGDTNAAFGTRGDVCEFMVSMDSSGNKIWRACWQVGVTFS